MAGQQVHSKLKQEINGIIRQKRTNPSQTSYDFVGLGSQSVTNTAHFPHSMSELSPDSVEWMELSAQDFEKFWCSDGELFSFFQSVTDDH